MSHSGRRSSSTEDFSNSVELRNVVQSVCFTLSVSAVKSWSFGNNDRTNNDREQIDRFQS